MKAVNYIGSDARGPRIQLFADSALGRDVMPLFVPEGFGALSLSVSVALRIGRLGKGIAPKFASRYIDAVSLTGVLGASGLSDLMGITDGAVTTGRWLDCDIAALPEISVEINGDERSLDTAALSIPQAVAAISAYATLKTGDIIILASSAVTFDVVREAGVWKLHSHSPDTGPSPSSLNCTMLGSPVLHLRLK